MKIITNLTGSDPKFVLGTELASYSNYPSSTFFVNEEKILLVSEEIQNLYDKYTEA